MVQHRRWRTLQNHTRTGARASSHCFSAVAASAEKPIEHGGKTPPISESAATCALGSWEPRRARLGVVMPNAYLWISATVGRKNLVSKQIVNLLVASAIAASATASVSSQPTAAVERHGDVCRLRPRARRTRCCNGVSLERWRERLRCRYNICSRGSECAAQSRRWRGNVSKKGRRDNTKNVTTIIQTAHASTGRADAAAAFAHWKQLRASPDLRP